MSWGERVDAPATPAAEWQNHPEYFTFLIARRTLIVAAPNYSPLGLARAEGVLLPRQFMVRASGKQRPFDCLSISKNALQDISPNAAQFLFLPIRATPALDLAHRYIAWVETAPERDGLAAEIAMRRFAELVACAFEQGCDASRRPNAAGALERIKARALEPDLTVADIAADLGVSPRKLQRILHIADLSFTVCLREARLKIAYERLIEACGDDLPPRVTDLALSCGFTDVSYFNRVFKRAYGHTPSWVRARSVIGRPDNHGILGPTTLATTASAAAKG